MFWIISDRGIINSVVGEGGGMGLNACAICWWGQISFVDKVRVDKCVDLFISTRLETRTKESNIDASWE